MSCGECGGSCQVCEICWQPECRHHAFKGPELFGLPESKSPRLQWMEKHGISTVNRHDGTWSASTYVEFSKGDTEDEAITQLALKLGIKLWNEEAKP